MPPTTVQNLAIRCKTISLLEILLKNLRIVLLT